MRQRFWTSALEKIHQCVDLFFLPLACPERFLQTTIFNVLPHAQKDDNSNRIFVIGCGTLDLAYKVLLSYCIGGSLFVN